MKTSSEKKINNDKWKVLITDDQELIHSMIQHYLEDYQFKGKKLEFLDAFSGKETKAILNENTDISVIILDIMLETINTGFEIVQYIRETLKNNMIKIIMLTGKLDIDNAKKFFMKYDIDMYCPKHDLSKIFFLMTSSLRAYERSYTNYQLQKQLKYELTNQQTAKKNLKDLNHQLEHLVHKKEEQLEKTTYSLQEAIAYAKQLTQEAESNNEVKGRFLANLSHEIRTPMNGILGMLGLTLNSELNKTQREYISLAKHSADHMLFLINDILDFSKLENDKLKIHNEFFKISNIIESAIAPLKLTALENGLELIYEIDPKIPEELFGPQDRLLQILINLIKNAIKFSECNDILIQAKINEQQMYTENIPDGHIEVLFSVKDKGVGMDQEMIKNIFDPFYQGHMELSESKGGLGLGLSICKQLVDMIGGKIWAESEPDNGSSFYFILPFKQKTVDAAIEEKETIGTHNTISEQLPQTMEEKKPKILLAEDHLINQDICVNVLEPNGYEVTVVMTGEEAIEAFEKEKFDLILMDIKMPEMDGLTATKIIRSKEPEEQHIPIIALTALAAEDDKDDCLKAGVDTHLAKPVDPNDMLMVVEQYLKTSDNLKNKTLAPEFRLMPGKRFDLEELKKKYDNNMDIIYKKLNNFKEHGKVLLGHIEKSLSDGNELLLGKYVHKLMNIASDAGARKISDNAFRCKLALRKDDNEKANQMVLKIKEEFKLFVSEIQYL